MKMQCLVRCLIVLAVVLLPMTAMAGEIARVQVRGSQVDWEPVATYESLVLTVSRPDGTTVRQEVAAGADVVFELAAGDPDGVYTWELRAAPRVSPEVRRELQKARRTGDSSVLGRLRREGKLPEDLVQSGSFTVAQGGIVPMDREERQGGAQTKDLGTFAEADQVIPDDLIVQGSGCFGFDCVNNESFGFDTIRLKENNLRIKFEDTSTGTFPTNDWQLTANDSASGGSSKFSIEDITGSKVPFTITAGASTNSIFVDSTGRVGFRTSTPVLDLHVATSNTPAIRLEQNNSGGFTAQTWDIAGNEANFFVRDVTSGSRLPFRIRPGAPTSSIDISADGDVGIGTASPSTKLHVSGSNGATKALIQESSGTTLAREMLEVRNNGASIVAISDTSTPGTRWTIGTSGTTFLFDDQGDAPVEMSLTTAGNMTITGTLTQNSSRDFKTNFQSLDPRIVLARVNELPLSMWTYKQDTARHFGPMAEDFYKAFGLGINDKGIAPGDTAGVALAAVQGLNQVVQEKDKEITELKSRIEALEKMVQSLTQKVEPQQ
ncbi:MAG TPA: tail fiber domain-containing protein [Thermoanaerobaculia bacterium]